MCDTVYHMRSDYELELKVPISDDASISICRPAILGEGEPLNDNAVKDYIQYVDRIAREFCSYLYDCRHLVRSSANPLVFLSSERLAVAAHAIRKMNPPPSPTDVVIAPYCVPPQNMYAFFS